MRSRSLRGELDLDRLDSPEGPHRYSCLNTSFCNSLYLTCHFIYLFICLLYIRHPAFDLFQGVTLTDLQEAEKTIGRNRPARSREEEKEKEEKEKQDKEKQEEKKEVETKEDDYRSRYRFEEVRTSRRRERCLFL